MAKRFTALFTFMLACIALSAQTLVHYWNFNNSTDEASLLMPTQGLIPGASIAHIQGGTSAIQTTSNTGQGFDVTNPNARNGDAASTHLRFNNPIGGELRFNLPTTGFDNVVVKYATRRSGSGAGSQVVFYTTNGTDFDSLTTISPIDGDPELQTLDFTGIPTVNDNPNFAIRITFAQGSGGTAGNNRFDNFTLESIPPVDPGSLPTVSFAGKNTMSIEGSSDVEIKLLVVGGGSVGSLNLEIVSASTAVAGNDYVLGTTNFDLPATDDTLSLLVNLPENTALTGGRYLILRMDTASNANLGTTTEHILLIADNEIAAPQAQASPLISLRTLGSFPGSPNGGSAEISAYDPASKRLFVTNIAKNTIDILDLKNPVAAAYIASIDMSPYGGGINSVAVKNGLVAAAVQGDSTSEDGTVVFFDAMGTYLNNVSVGNLPDMVIFNNAGTQVLTANEGEPSSDYSIDPLGSISIIDMAPGVANLSNANVTTLTFEGFDTQIDALRAAGVRIYGLNATVGRDLEPEYICVSPDDQSALVTLQENNAVASINLATLQITGIRPLGYKDLALAGNWLDASDQAPGIFMANWPVKGAYMPDAIECFEVGGITYAITANEGDAREWGSFVESQRLNSLNLDSLTFPNANYLKKSELLGRLNVLSYDGDTDGDGDLDEIHAFGGRSFSIWNTATGALVWDSGDALETITAADPSWGSYFNASNGATPTRKNRSDDKGPEPEAVTIAEIEGRIFAFVGLERIGGIIVYEVSNPTAPEFIQYINTRTLTGGDLGPEGLIFIPKNESPNGRNLIVLSNEISGTVTVFQVELDRTNGGGLTLNTYDYTPTTTIVDFNGGTIFDGGISGLHHITGSELEFYAVSDRGPNADASGHPNATGTTLLFPKPDYAPVVTRFKAENGAWTVQSIEPIKRPDNSPISGLPLPVGAGNTGETAWSDTIPNVLTPDTWGMDTEGIVEDKDGNLWLCDEYGASVWKINKDTKQVIKRYTPYPTQPEDAPLPIVIGKRRANRGFEGVAVTPNGKVYAFLQSVADNPNVAAGNNGRLLRLVEIDPVTDSIRQFAYEIQPETGQIRTRDWKVGDLVAINNNEFLLVEHAERNGWNVKNIYKIDLSEATPLVTDDFNGQTLEQVGTAAAIAAFGVKTVQKTHVLDLLEAGWDRTHDKPEGLTIVNDSTIAVVNDNDFGINSPAANGTILYTGKTTRLYVYGLPEKLNVQPVVTFNDDVMTIDEGTGDVNVGLVVSEGSRFGGAVKVSVVDASTATNGDDYVLGTAAFDIPPFFEGNLNMTVNFPDNAAHTGGKYLILKIDETSNARIGEEDVAYVLVADNDIPVPAAQSNPYVELSHLVSFPGNPNGGSAEISAFDPVSKRIFATNIINNTLDITDFSNPANPVFLESLDMSAYGGGINSVSTKNGIVAVAIQGDTTTEDGTVVFLDANGDLISQVTVGNLPDMVIFSHDGTKVLTANEGEPSSDYGADPLGSVSIIDLSVGVANLSNSNVTTLTFESFDSQIDALRAAGVRIYGPNATVGKDLEPEYICVSPDDKTALVTLQENNAVATIDLQTMTITAISPLGYKDHSQVANIIDGSDRGGKIFSAAWPIQGAYMPDAIECFEVGGITYAITANEGDAREWSSFVESKRLGSLDLDPTAFPDAEYLQKNELLGRLNVLSYDGDTDGDGDLDEVYSFGGRSFTIWNTATGAAVWDSGDDLEAITAYDNPAYFNFFNAAPGFRSRSDDKGPEPEGVTVAEIDGKTFAFVAFERTGGLVAYDVTNPSAPEFIQYINTRVGTGGDISPEGIKFIPWTESPNGKNLILVSYEVSGTMAVFELNLNCTVNAGDDLAVCEGETATLSAANGFETYTWSNGNTGQSIQTNMGGVYTVTATTAGGCEANDAVALTVNPNPVVDLGPDAAFCSNETFTLDAGAGYTGYLWSDNSSSQTLTASAAGTYEVVVEDANGCLGADAITLAILPAPTPDLGADIVFCEGQFTNIDAGAGFVNYEWSTGAISQTIQVTEGGVYSVLVTAPNGCQASDGLLVTVNPTPDVNLGLNQTICEGETATLIAGAGFSNYAWSTGEVGQSIQVTQTGTYSVVVSNSFGCTDLDAATVFVNPAPVVDLGMDTVVYEPNSYVLNAGSGAGFTFLWSDGSTDQTLTVTEDGTYSVTVTEGSTGCSSTDEVSVSIEPNAVKENALSGSLVLFPNPSAGHVNLAFTDFEPGTYSVRLYDQLGKLAFSQSFDIQSGSQTLPLNLGHLTKGAYLVKVVGDKGWTTRRIIMQ